MKVDVLVFISENACTKRICGRLDRNVANKYLYGVVVECFSP